MAGNTNRFSTYTSLSSGSDSQREQKKDLWQTLLGEVATGKQFPQKNLLVLGDTVASQKQFVEALSNHALRESLGRLRSEKVPEIANSFALGNTYYDVLESDQEGDILARVSVHFLNSPSPSFTTLLKQLLTPQSIPNTMVVILLNWSKPWMWMRELREWILLLRKVVVSLSMESKDIMEEVMQSWKDRGRVGGSMNLDGSPGPAQTGESEAALPIGTGEWDEPLGLPLCVVCQNAEKIDSLEKSAWKEEQFDLVLQYLRTVLLKHGASLIYTSVSVPSPLQNLIHSSLGIKSLSSKKDPLKANVIDRDKILVPPNYDSWSKIRVLRDGFDVEAVSSGWGLDLDQGFPSLPAPENGIATNVNGHISHAIDEPGSAVLMYEEMVRDPSFDTQLLASQGEQAAKYEETQDMQTFLAAQQKTLETLRLKSEAQSDDGRREDEGYGATSADLTKKIGPVQFNMGGVQVDADDMVRRLKDHQLNKDKEPTSPTSDEGHPEVQDMEKIQAFFTGLMMKTKP